MGLPLTFSDLDDFGWSSVTGFPIVRNSPEGSRLDEDYVHRLQNLDNQLRLFFGYYELNPGHGEGSRRQAIFNYLDVFGSLEDVLAEGPQKSAMDRRIRARVARTLATEQDTLDMELLNSTQFTLLDVDVQAFMVIFMIVQGLRMRRKAQERPIAERLRKRDQVGRTSNQVSVSVSAGTTTPHSSQALTPVPAPVPAPVLTPVSAPVPAPVLTPVSAPVPPPRTRRQSMRPTVRRLGPESGAVPRPTQPPPPIPGPTHCAPLRPPRRKPRSTLAQSALGGTST